MTKTPGENPGSSSFSGSAPSRAYARPGAALAIAAAAYAVTIALSWPGVRPRVSAGPPWATTLVDAALLLGPLLAGALLAARLGGPAVARALGLYSQDIRGEGIRFRPLDLLLGALVALVARATMEVASPTTGSLRPAFADSDADATAAVVVSVAVVVVLAPVIEELFFRGAVQRGLNALLGRSVTPRVAAVLAIAVSTVAFVMLHAVPYGAQVPLSVVLPPALIGVGAGVLTAVSGRITAGVVAHMLFNLAGVVLLIV